MSISVDSIRVRQNNLSHWNFVNYITKRLVSNKFFKDKIKFGKFLTLQTLNYKTDSIWLTSLPSLLMGALPFEPFDLVIGFSSLGLIFVLLFCNGGCSVDGDGAVWMILGTERRKQMRKGSDHLSVQLTHCNWLIFWIIRIVFVCLFVNWRQHLNVNGSVFSFSTLGHDWS